MLHTFKLFKCEFKKNLEKKNFLEGTFLDKVYGHTSFCNVLYWYIFSFEKKKIVNDKRNIGLLKWFLNKLL